MKIPDFLKRENMKSDTEADKMRELIDEYKKKIGDDLITEPSSYTEREWISMLGKCIENNITIWELWGEKYDPKAEY